MLQMYFQVSQDVILRDSTVGAQSKKVEAAEGQLFLSVTEAHSPAPEAHEYTVEIPANEKNETARSYIFKEPPAFFPLAIVHR